MFKRYRVKAEKNKLINPDTINKDGYLKFGENWGKFSNTICIYGRGEAIKKAKMFNGKIEVDALSNTMSEIKLLNIPNNAILYDVELLLAKQPQTDGLYMADVFFTILADTKAMSDKTRLHLTELCQIAQGFDRVLIAK